MGTENMVACSFLNAGFFLFTNKGLVVGNGGVVVRVDGSGVPEEPKIPSIFSRFLKKS